MDDKMVLDNITNIKYCFAAFLVRMKFSMLLVSSSPPKTSILIMKKYRNTNIRIVTRIFKRIIIIFQNHFHQLLSLINAKNVGT